MRINLHVLCGVLRVRTEVHDDHRAALQPLQPIAAPAHPLDLVHETGLHTGLCGRLRRWALPVGSGLMVTKGPAPRRELAGRVVVEAWVDTAAAESDGGSDLPDGQASLTGGHNGPAPFLCGVNQACGGAMKPRFELLCTTDAWSGDRTSFHGLEESGLAHNGPANWTG